MKRKKILLISIIAGGVLALAGAGVGIGFAIDNANKEKTYQEGIQNLVDANYAEAYKIFTGLENYKDSPKKRNYANELYNVQEG